MKKVSISIVALLAIVLATASAFTTQVFENVPDGPGWYLAQPSLEPIYVGSGPTADYDDAIYESVRFHEDNPPTSEECSLESGRVCAAFFEADGDNIQDTNSGNIFVVLGERL